MQLSNPFLHSILCGSKTYVGWFSVLPSFIHIIAAHKKLKKTFRMGQNEENVTYRKKDEH